MKKIILMGQRANRTPFSYPAYKELFQRRFKYVDKPETADFLVYSCLMDIRNDADKISRIFSIRPDLQLVVLSEEPLWDTLWSGDFLSKKSKVRIRDAEYPFYFLNLFTTRIYDFEKIPYFITTNDDYFARYAFLFARNRTYNKLELLSFWDKAPIRTAFYAEHRNEVQYDANFSINDVWGLSRYRTLVAEGLHGNGIIRRGRGWESMKMRQSLPDWH
ncbi:MAG: hypothetical protein PVI90_15815, partial [Desulfobacteraceae bacterium]